MDLSYAYSNARIKAMKSKLIPESRMREIMEVRSISEMTEILEETEYKESFVSASTKYKGMELISRALHGNLRKTLERIMKITPKKGRESLRILLMEYEIENIKAILAGKASGVDVKETDLMALDKKSLANLKKLNEKASVEEVVRELRTSEFGRTLQKSTLQYEKQKDFRVFLSALNAYYFEKLNGLAKREKSRILRELLEARMRAINVMTVLRVKSGDAKSDASPYLIKSNDNFVKELNQMQETHRMFEKMKSKYKKIVQEIEESEKGSSLIPLEIALDREIARKTLRSLRFSILDFGVVLSFLYLKQEEINTLRKIAYAKQYGFSDELKKMVVAVSA